MLRDDIERYSKLTGENGWGVPLSRVGAYLDGYNKGLEVVDKIRAEIMQLDYDTGDILEIIDKYKEGKG